jgi:hypothetical protein
MEKIQEFKCITQSIDYLKLKEYKINIYDTILYCSLYVDNIIYDIKIITNFLTYCYIEPIENNTINDLINKFNISIIFKDKFPNLILNEIKKCITVEVLHTNYVDFFHIFQKIEEFNKCPLDLIQLEKAYSLYLTKNKSSVNNIPKKLLFTPTQINQMIIKEINKINKNKKYEHYIYIDYNNPYTLILRLKYNVNSDIGKILNYIKTKYDYDYIEMHLTLDAKTYPFMPPKFEYIKQDKNKK